MRPTLGDLVAALLWIATVIGCIVWLMWEWEWFEWWSMW
jgi:hypothetical protein